MCGIFGTTLSLKTEQLQAIKESLHHRGPDSSGMEGITSNNGRDVVFQHTRLAIQDLSPKGHQPMVSQCGRWWVTFNGEIYNHFDLRKELSIDFRSTSDTETLIEYIVKFGVEKTVQQLNGIFAFAALDTHDNKLFVVRDPFGIKPVYYQQNGTDISFASEIKPLLLAGGKPSLNPDGLALFLTLRYSPSPTTLLSNIQRLAPGHVAVFDLEKSSLAINRYCEPTTQRFSGSLEEAVDAYHQMLGKAIKRQLLSDVPLGILLSGGIDSAMVALHAKDHPGITGYTVGFGDHYDDCEIADAAETADTLGINKEHITVDPTQLINDLPAIINAIEEPLGTTSVMAMWGLTQLARRGVTVALTGQGSDEPWGGYRRYKIEHLLNTAPLLKSSLFKPLQHLSGLSKNEAISRGLGCLGIRDQAARFKAAYALFTEAQVAGLFPDYRRQYAAETSIQAWLDWLPSGLSLSDAEKMMRVDTRMNLADDLLLYGDKISMAFALEARVPMLDIDLIQFVESLPLHYRSTYTQTKIVHKLAAKKYLPDHIVNRRKKGFQVPFGEWCRTQWRQVVEDQLLDASNPIFSTLQRRGVESIWRQHTQGERDFSKQIFALYSLMLWAKQYL